MEYAYDIETIKNELSISQIADIMADLGAEPKENGDIITCKTICHHKPGESCSHKLYYYNNSHLFRCYTHCDDAVDIFSLVHRHKKQEEPNYTLPQAIKYVAEYFGYSPKTINFEDDYSEMNDYWDALKAFDRIKVEGKEQKKVELKTYDAAVMKNLPRPRILPWEREGISKQICDYYNICYNPKSCGIVIPHYDINGSLIGIRERTLIQEQAEMYGKYHPARINGKMYNHPLSFALYGLDKSKPAIQRFKKAIVFEGEKAVLQYASYYGTNNNIAVAACGNQLINYQLDLLLSLGTNEIVIAFDHDFNDIKEDTAKKLIDKYKKMYIKYGNKVTLSFIWDKEGVTGYKSSPIDHGKEVFEELYRNRINLYR